VTHCRTVLASFPFSSSCFSRIRTDAFDRSPKTAGALHLMLAKTASGEDAPLFFFPSFPLPFFLPKLSRATTIGRRSQKSKSRDCTAQNKEADAARVFFSFSLLHPVSFFCPVQAATMTVVRDRLPIALCLREEFGGKAR